MHTIIYIHGFGSSAESSTAKRIADFYGDSFNVVAASYDYVNPTIGVEQLTALIQSEASKEGVEQIILFGSSLGGYFARYLANTMVGTLGDVQLNLAMVNPSLMAYENCAKYIGENKSFSSEELIMIAMDYPEQLKKYAVEIDHPALNIHVVVATDDETVSPWHTLDVYARRAEINEVTGGHRVFLDNDILNRISMFTTSNFMTG